MKITKYHNIGFLLQNWWDNDRNAIAFSRGNQGFIAISQELYDVPFSGYTGLSEGTYCDVISGHKDGGFCTGTSVYVDGNGYASFSIPDATDWTRDAIVAFHQSK